MYFLWETGREDNHAKNQTKSVLLNREKKGTVVVQHDENTDKRLEMLDELADIEYTVLNSL